jgi:exosome complex RNA-binding protein Rrp42 (RNase PH superfamily)
VEHDTGDGNNGSYGRSSVTVRMGSTVVRSAIHLQVGQPALGCQGGDVQVSIVDTTTTGGSQAYDHSVMESYLQRWWYDAFDREQLTIVDRKAAFRLQVMIVVLHNDGGLRDVALLSGSLSLRYLSLPALVYREETATTVIGRVSLVQDRGEVIRQGKQPGDQHQSARKLDLPAIPVSTTVGFWYPNGSDSIEWIVDPTVAEMDGLDGYVSVVVSISRANSSPILALDVVTKTAGAAVTPQDIVYATQIASGRANELRTMFEL